MKTKLKDVLHLYLGCQIDTRFGKSEMTAEKYRIFTQGGFAEIKPILRRLSDMTVGENEDARKIYEEIDKYAEGDMKLITEGSAKVTTYFLERGFDLFGLIESGQAIDKSAPIS